MKYLLLTLIIILSGCASITYYPSGDYMKKVQYFICHKHILTCDICKEKAYLFKKSSNGKIICDKCYRKIKGNG